MSIYRNPLRGFMPVPNTDQEILDIDQVAAWLRCSVDTVRRIPRTELMPRRGPGRAHLYLREDIIEYLRHRPLSAPKRRIPASAEPAKPQQSAAIDFAEKRKALQSMEQK